MVYKFPTIGFTIREICRDYATSFQRFQEVQVHCLKMTNFFARVLLALGQLIVDFTPLGQQQRQFLEASQLLKPYVRPEKLNPVLAHDAAANIYEPIASVKEGKAPSGIQGLDSPD